MTRKLFEENVYMREATCHVVERITKDDKKVLVLDQTIFFPEGGGQKSDLGTIGTSKVLNVTIKDNIIYHEVSEFPEADEVLCSIDWERRFDHMQQHCGEHILSGVFLKLFDLRNKGFHLGEDYLTIDMDVKELDANQMEAVEIAANKAIIENHQVKSTTVQTTEEASKFPLRKIPDVEEDIRIIEIDDVDTVACCGTHPETTAEVGLIKILKWQSYKGMVRVFFKCGNRALRDYQVKHELLNKLNKKYSADVTSLYDKIEIDSKKKKALMDEVSSLRKQISEDKANVLIEKSKNLMITQLYDELSVEMLQLVSNQINKSKKGYMIMIGSLSSGTLIMTHDGSLNIMCGQLVKDHMPKEGAKGGGGKARAQVMFSDMVLMKNFYEEVKSNLISELL